MDENNRYYQSRHFLRLLHRYEKAVAEGHVPYLEADELTDIAEYYMTDKQDEKANQAIQAAIDMHPDATDPQIFLARQKMFYGQLDEAQAIVDAIIEQENNEVIYVRAELLIRQKQALEASEYLLEEMELMQDSLETYLYDCTAIFMDYDQWELAEIWAGRLRDICPAHPSLPLMEAEISMGLDDYETAETMLQELLDSDPYSTEAWNLLAESYVALERYADAREAADYALAINPRERNALLMKANACMHDNQLPQAIRYYAQCLEMQPDDLSVQMSLAICYNNTEQYEKAVSLLTTAEQRIEKQPEDRQADLPHLLLIRAFALGKLKKYDEALSAIDRAQSLADGQEPWLYHIARGEIYLWLGKMSMAEKHFIHAMEKGLDRCEMLFNIALIHSRAGYYENAINMLNDVWAFYGTRDGRFVVPYLADCYLKHGDMENFLKHLRMAPSCNRELTIQLFGDRYPGTAPEDYYAYAYRELHGHFPDPDTPDTEAPS